MAKINFNVEEEYMVLFTGYTLGNRQQNMDRETVQYWTVLGLEVAQCVGRQDLIVI